MGTPNVMGPSNPMMENKHSSIGPVIGLVVILAVIVVGSLYFWGQRANDNSSTGENMYSTQEEGTPYTGGDTSFDGSSDDINTIESDLNVTNFTDIDAGAEQLQ